MAVAWVKQLWPGRGGADDIEKRVKLNHVYEVKTTDPNDDATVAGGTDLLPRLGDSHPNYAGAYVVAVTPNQDDADPTLWTVKIDYSTDLPFTSAQGGSGIALGPGPESQYLDSAGEPVNRGSPTNRPVHPLERGVVLTRTIAEIEEPFRVDKNGLAVKNSAGLPFDPPLMTKFRYLLCTFVKNVSGISNSTILQYMDTVNDGIWKGIQAGKALIVQFDAASNLEETVAYTQVTLGIAVTTKVFSWKRRVIDQGFYKKTALGGGAFAWDRIRDPKTGMPKTEPTLLDGAGGVLAVGTEPVKLDFIEFGDSNFNTLMTLLGIE